MTSPDPSTAGDAADLAKFGYQQSMERRTGKFASFAVAFAFVSIATGIFTTYGAVLNSSGPMGIWTWPIATLGQLAVAFILGALAARIPVTGYHYQWMSRLANPTLGWMLGWISFTFLAIVVVAIPLPWMAVLIANDRPPRRAEEPRRYQNQKRIPLFPTAERPALDIAPPRAPQPDADGFGRGDRS